MGGFPAPLDGLLIRLGRLWVFFWLLRLSGFQGRYGCALAILGDGALVARRVAPKPTQAKYAAAYQHQGAHPQQYEQQRAARLLLLFLFLLFRGALIFFVA